jgi:signal transduction histidine kinase
MKIELEKKKNFNFWLIKARWVYIPGLLALELMAKSLSWTNVNFHYLQIFIIYASFLLFNLLIFLVLKFFNSKFKSVKKEFLFLKLVSFFQVVADLFFFLVIFHYEGGIESTAFIFFLLPIFYTSLLFGMRGSLITALYIGIIINLLVILEFHNFISHINRYNESSPELSDLNLSLTKTSVISVFYIIAAFFAGYFSDLISKREKVIYKNLQDLKREKRKLREERDKISSIISNFIDPVLVVDNEGKITYLNPSAKKELEIGNSQLREKISSKNNYSLKNFQKIFGKKIEVEEVPDSVSGGKIEEVFVKSGKKSKIYKVLTPEIAGEAGQSLGYMKIFYDITREKEMDKLKSEFVSIAAHQLRTPLSAIKWTLKSVIDEDQGKLKKEQKSILMKSYESNQRIINLVNDLLNVLKIEEGRFGYTFTKVNISKLVEKSASDFEKIIKRNKLNLKVEKPEKEVEAYLDEEKIIMVIQNLLDNAIKYSGSGENIYLRVKREKNDLIRFEVEDEGVGIPKDSKEKLFSKFFRGSNVVKMETGGSGLGLYISKNIVKKHGGDMKVESEESKGTKVSFTVRKDLYT